MIVGETPKAEDISVNVCKKKQLTNMRASGSDEALRLTPPKQMSMEQCLEVPWPTTSCWSAPPKIYACASAFWTTGSA